jgi:hypothetical protein
MILELAILQVLPGKEKAFEADFKIAGYPSFFKTMPGATQQIHPAGRLGNARRPHRRVQTIGALSALAKPASRLLRTVSDSRTL